MWRRSSCVRRNTDSAGDAGASAESASRAWLAAVLWRPGQAQLQQQLDPDGERATTCTVNGGGVPPCW